MSDVDASKPVPRAVDRRTLAGQPLPPKTSKWPRTGRREERIDAVLARRQPDLTVVLEDIHDPHNVSAVLRSCDAVGILRVHAVYVEEVAPSRAFARTTSGSAAKWLEVVRHDSVEECYAALREDGFQILATALDDRSVPFYAQDLTQPTALVFGNEMRGISTAAADLADDLVAIPMMGMVQSLNISVACAVSVFEAMRQRDAAGRYDQPALGMERRTELRAEWLKR